MTDKRQMKHNKNKQAAGTQSPKRVSRRDLKRRRLVKRILGFIMLLAVIGAGFYFAMKLLFVVRTVDIKGSEIFTVKEISDFIAIPEEQNIFKIDADAMENAIVEEFTYIDSAKVTRRLPDRIDIILEDSRECYYAIEGEKYAVYSQSFKKLRNAAEPPQGAVWLDIEMDNEEKPSRIFSSFRKVSGM